MTDRQFRTTKMALVAYLRGREIMHSGMEQKGDQVTWLFSDSDALQREVDVYRQGEASVEPVAFTRATARVREEMFRFKEQQDAAAV